MQTIENCQLEWDEERGVLYVHDKDTGGTVLRICRLKEGQYKPLKYSQIDITGPFSLIAYPRKRLNAND